MSKAPKFIPFKNVSKSVLNVPDLGIENLHPGDVAHVQEGYAFPRRSNAGGRRPSILEDLASCPGCPERVVGKHPDGTDNHVTHCLLEPVNADDAARFSATPEAKASKLKPEAPTVESLMAMGLSQGQAETFIKGILAVAEAAKEEAKEEANAAPSKDPKATKANKDPKPAKAGE